MSPGKKKQQALTIPKIKWAYGGKRAIGTAVKKMAGLSTQSDTLLPQAFGQAKTQLISLEEGVGKMKAALDGLTDEDAALDADAVAVILDLVNPFRTGRWAVRWTGEAGLDEVSRMGQGTFAQHAVAPRRNLFDGH